MNKRKNISKLIAAATKELPLNEQFLNDLKTTIEKEEQENKRKPSQSYKPSSMKCVRNMYYQVKGEERDGTSSGYCLIGIGESGTDRHERLQNAVTKMIQHTKNCEYVDVETYIKQHEIKDLKVVSKIGYETKLYNEKLNISFLCDGIIKYKNRYYILEIKTETSYKWQSRKGVDPDHYAQGTTYSINLGINEVMFVYENRDNCDKKCYILEVTDEMKMEVIEKIEESDNALKKMKAPDIPLDLNKRTCTYCDYKKQCRKDGGWIWE